MNSTHIVLSSGPRICASVVERAGRRQIALRLGAAFLALATGLLVYLVDRDASRSLLIPTIAALAHLSTFGVLGQWLPSFVHPLAFSLFTAAALAPRLSVPYGVCLAWGAVNVAFELGQHPQISGRLAELLHVGLGHGLAANALSNYLVRGTFDTGDIAAALLGAMAAAIVLSLTQTVTEASHAQ